MNLFETNKEDLRRRNRELRHKMIVKAQEIAAKKKETESKLQQKQREEDLKSKTKYPDVILTMMKRLRRISPWSPVVSMNPYQASLIAFFKLKQLGIKECRFSANAMHSWVEFKYDDRWWTFDLIAVRETHLGDPIKSILIANEDEYKALTAHYDLPYDFIEKYHEHISITIDDAKIIAMEDDSLNTIRINYH
jgi:hypothetical protein